MTEGTQPLEQRRRCCDAVWASIALFALALYLALKSNLVEFVQTAGGHRVYYYATVGFVAGFSERRAKVLLDSVGLRAWPKRSRFHSSRTSRGSSRATRGVASARRARS